MLQFTVAESRTARLCLLWVTVIEIKHPRFTAEEIELHACTIWAAISTLEPQYFCALQANVYIGNALTLFSSSTAADAVVLMLMTDDEATLARFLLRLRD